MQVSCSDVDDSAQWGSLQPVTFLESAYVPSKNLWWQRQLQAARGHDNHLQEQYRFPALSSYDLWRSVTHFEQLSLPASAFQHMQAF